MMLRTCALWIVALASCATTPQAPPAWSPVVEDLRGRLIVTSFQECGSQGPLSVFKHANCRTQAKLELELENVGDGIEPLAIAMSRWKSIVGLVAEDANGKELDAGEGGGNEFGVVPFALQITARTKLRVTLAASLYQSGWIFPFHMSTFWKIPESHGTLYLRGSIRPIDSDVAGSAAWKGPLELPRVALP
jgi:hypothetical protein